MVLSAAAAATLLAAAWVGTLTGSGAYDMAGVRGAEGAPWEHAVVAEATGTPEIPGHPGSAVKLERRDLLRQFMNLDAMN